MTHRIASLASAVIFLGLAWAALTGLYYLVNWAPDTFACEAARMIAMGVAAAILLLSGAGAAAGLLGLFVASGKERAVRPYVPVQ